ncbi:MAG: signal peptidase I [Candidatus Nezhaarchaeales archaeon]
MRLKDTFAQYKGQVSTLTLIIGIYVVLNSFNFTGLLAYVIPSLLWTLSFLISLYLIGGLRRFKLETHRFVIIIAFLTALLQIVSLNLVALFTEFGRSPYSFTLIGMITNIVYFTAPILAQETARAYVVKSVPRSRKYTGLILVTVFFMFLKLSAFSFIAQNSLADSVKFLASKVLPAGAQSLLSTYLALIGGPLASITYVWTIEAYNWLAPILPKPPWGVESLITTLTPAIGVIMINEALSPMKLIAVGIMNKKDIKQIKLRGRKASRSVELVGLVAALIMVAMVWGTSGLLGYQASVVVSGSMRPMLDVGDIIVTVQTSAEKVHVGDVIQYLRSGIDSPIAHRVVEVSRSGGVIVIVTKGDANNVPDEPIVVIPSQKLWKLVFAVPKIGWASIFLKNMVGTVAVYLTENPLIAYVLLTAVINASIIYAYKHVNGSRKIVRR